MTDAARHLSWNEYKALDIVFEYGWDIYLQVNTKLYLKQNKTNGSCLDIRILVVNQYYSPANQIGQEETALHASFTQVWSSTRDVGTVRRPSHSKQLSTSVDLYQL